MLGAQGGAASAPQSSGSSGGASHGGAGGGAPQRHADGGGDGDGGGFDGAAALAEIRKARQGMQKIATEFDSYKRDAEGDRKTLKRLQSALTPEGDAEQTGGDADPVQGLEQQLDYYLEQAMLAREAGKAMPLTTNLAIQFFQSQIQNIKTINELKGVIKELRQGVDHAADPATPVNNMAYAQMETYLQQSLDQLYGSDPQNGQARNNIYRAVTSQLAADLKQLQKQAPAQWDQLRRNPGQMQKVVSQALRSIVPPKAMQLIEQDHLANTPMSEGELWAAWREAEGIKDPQQRKEIRERLRRDILVAQQAATRRKRR